MRKDDLEPGKEQLLQTIEDRAKLVSLEFERLARSQLYKLVSRERCGSHAKKDMLGIWAEGNSCSGQFLKYRCLTELQ